MRKLFLVTAVLVVAAIGVGGYYSPGIWWSYAFVGPLVVLGLADVMQTRHAVRRNFPIIGHGRYLMEMVRPEINQYFVESNTDGTPFNREQRSLVYQRA